MTVVPALVGAGAKVRVCDPEGEREGAALLPGVSWEKNPYKAAQNAQLVVLLTEWNEFRALDLKRLARKMDSPRLADFRNVCSVKDAKRAKFERYESLGRSDYSAG